ncbi:TIGR02217 family protein [Aureimonas phyllosphaerae]|uniref:phage distal tail protein, Rcc01695 family n=1 Tax=Aureimonas phyllosphaerae TaxID=1166078 RepID=UPI003A5BE053
MIASFSEERFPLRVAFGTAGGPERRTDIVRLSNGYENRNQRTRHSWRRYDAGSGVRSIEDLVAVLHFFEARRGRLTGFRFRDPFDLSSAPGGGAATVFDQRIGTGDGEARVFQLVKRYGVDDDAYVRPIGKPVPGSVRVGVDGAELGQGFSVDPSAGTVSFAVAPMPGAVVTAGFEFDVPVRFDMDHLSINIAAFEAGDIPSIPLVEVRP